MPATFLAVMIDDDNDDDDVVDDDVLGDSADAAAGIEGVEDDRPAAEGVGGGMNVAGRFLTP